MDTDSESDEETQIQELRQLHAVLEADEPTASEASSIRFSSTASSSNTRSCNSVDRNEYSSIQKAIALNKLTDEKMRKLEGILVSRLRECRQKLRAIQDLQNSTSKSDKPHVFRYINCARPYFKDYTRFPPPDNEDTITMRDSGMYDFSEITSVAGWTVKDKSEFLKEILKMTKEIKKREINSQIAQLKRDMKVKDCKTIPLQIKELKKQIENLSKMVLDETTALPLDKEYDWDAVAAGLNRRHSPQEYRSLWKLYLHPSINKTKWSKTEHLKLQEVAEANQLHDWEKIAKELDTGRTGYQCFVYYRTNMSNTFSRQKWTKEEEEYLRRLIDYYREDDYIPWGKVAASMENRTKIQIYNKYSRLMEQRKGRFLPEEDAVLLTCIDNFGTDFRKLMKYLPGRSSQQLRTRYQILKNKSRTSMVWTADEDKKLIQLMSNQDSNVNFSALTKHFPDKNRAQLRARYVTLVKWMKKFPNRDISKAPRRGARRLGHGQSLRNLNMAVENLKQRIQSEVEIKKSKKVTKNSPEDVIENAIVATLVTEHVRNEEYKKLSDNGEINFNIFNQSLEVSEADLKKLLIMLKARLHKDTFISSSYALKYPRLADDEANYVFKVKSYSRKSQKINITKSKNDNNSAPDIWGEKPLQTASAANYVIPPHYATITGCKKLMAYISAPGVNNRSTLLHNLIKKNSVLKKQVDIFVQRFCTLFLWPSLLSNEEPQFGPVVSNIDDDYIERRKREREKLCGIVPSVGIPCMRQDYNSTDDSIDLDTSGENGNDNTVLTQVYDEDEDYGVLNKE